MKVGLVERVRVFEFEVLAGRSREVEISGSFVLPVGVGDTVVTASCLEAIYTSRMPAKLASLDVERVFNNDTFTFSRVVDSPRAEDG